LTLTGCGTTDVAADDDRLHVVSSFSMLSDIVEEVGGEDVAVHNIVPVGNAAHEYEAAPTDTRAPADASAYFSNGLNLEGGEQGWAARMVESVDFDQDHVYETTEGVEPEYLSDEQSDNSSNPHAFLDPNVGMVMAETVANGLSEVDPDNTYP